MSMHKLSAITLDFAQTAFENFPNNETAGVYLRTLMEYEADDQIDDDTFLDGLASIAVYLHPALADDANERDQQDPAADWMKR